MLNDKTADVAYGLIPSVGSVLYIQHCSLTKIYQSKYLKKDVAQNGLSETLKFWYETQDIQCF